MSDDRVTKNAAKSPDGGQSAGWLFAKAILLLVGLVITIVVVQWLTT